MYFMKDPLFLTIIFIALTTMVAAFVRKRKKDKCLKDFTDYLVTLEQLKGDSIFGKLRVENTGLELTYPSDAQSQNSDQTSYILYKNEYLQMRTLIRFHDDLTELGKKKRQIQLEKTYHPVFLARTKRKTVNVFKTIRDSVMEVANLLMSRAKKVTSAGSVLTSQDKYVNEMKKQLVGSVGTSYEPLLERYIGHHVILEMVKGDAIIKYQGVLKDYTADFLEVMDIDYKITDNQQPRKADLVISCKYGTIRGLAE